MTAKKLFTIVGRHPAAVSWGVALVVIAAVLCFCEADFLWKIEQQNLFLNTTLFLKEQLVTAGGLLVWVSAFFTQFFYYPWLGTLLLCCWWWLLMWLVLRTFRIPRRWAVLALIPTALLLLTIVDMGYWIYMLKLRGHVFVGTIGTSAVVALLWGFRRLPGHWLPQVLYTVAVSAAGYLLMGIYALAAALLMAVWSWRLYGRHNGLACSLAALLSVVGIPLFCYRYVYYQTNLANIYFTDLPLYFLTSEYHAYYLPYYLLALFLLVAVLTSRQTAEEPTTTLSRRDVLLQTLLVAGLTTAVAWFWYKDDNFHRELAMQHAIERSDWEGVLNVARRQTGEPTRSVVVMRNIALARLGRQGNEMFTYPNGSKRYDAPFDISMMVVTGPLAYYQYGLLNYSNRLCMEMCVEFNWRVEYMKQMVRCAILSGDQALARKYISLLTKTTFHADWAEQARQCLLHPEQVASHPELEPVTHMLHYDNSLNSDQGKVERLIMTQLANSRSTADPVFQEQALLATLWTHSQELFWKHFADYVRLHPDKKMPRYYQEAAYLFGQLEGRSNLDKMPFDSYIRQSFDHFMQSAEPYEDGDVNVARQALAPLFGDTYYYDYFLTNPLTDY